MELFSDKIIIHSKRSEKEVKNKSKIVYVPHPDYIDVYGQIAENKTAKNKLKLLFLGLVKPYKNIELLVDVFNELNLENAELSICGFAEKNYKEKLLKKIANSKNISLNLRFITDDKIPQILAQHHILLTPYDSKSVLNSGSIILAFSYKRTVLSPNNGTLSDFENKNMFFSYEYKNLAEHKNILKEKILFLYENYSNNYNRLLELGEECFESVRKNNSPEKVSGILEKLFESEVK
jgi:glycosyltransferase involved in cell wall biosynthesis